MTSFKSRHYPNSGQPFGVLQEYAMRYYGIFTAVVMAGVLLLMSEGKNIFWFGIIGAAVSIALGNAVAWIAARSRRAEIFFVGDAFAIISVHDIIFKKEPKSFPVRLANPARVGETIHLHFQDEVVILKKDNWQDFELIWEWLNPPQVNYTVS